MRSPARMWLIPCTEGQYPRDTRIRCKSYLRVVQLLAEHVYELDGRKVVQLVAEHVYELDGRKVVAVDHGQSTHDGDLLLDACDVVKKFMERYVEPQKGWRLPSM